MNFGLLHARLWVGCDHMNWNDIDIYFVPDLNESVKLGCIDIGLF